MSGVYKNTSVYASPDSSIAEAIRSLRTNIQFLNSGKKCQIISITSSMPEEGKTFIAVNLAVVNAEAKKRTLLVDCDLRRPNIDRTFNLKPGKGLSSILSGDKDSLEKMPFHHNEIAGLTILPSGPNPSNPAELLESKAMDELLSKLREQFDIIILDTPPVLNVTDPIIVARKSDGLIFVALANSTSAKAVARSYNLLKEAGVNIIGAVLNRGDVDLYSYGYYKYASYYR